MIDINKHKFFLIQMLKDIYSDPELAATLGFKGGTAMMLFHDLPRFSVDLDFNLLGDSESRSVYDKLRQILMNYGNIHDEAEQHYGMILVLDYEQGGRNLKLEVSIRDYPARYNLRDYLGISMKVMDLEYMFTHKLMAILDRSSLTNRDVFDTWFYMNKRLMLKKVVLDARLDCTLDEYLGKCIEAVQNIGSNRILDGMGELMDADLKKWVKGNLVAEFVQLANMYRAIPLLE